VLTVVVYRDLELAVRSDEERSKLLGMSPLLGVVCFPVKVLLEPSTAIHI
jgi:hypothetical protein